MVTITKCCFVFTLRQGTYACAVYAMLLSLVGVALCAVLLHSAEDTVQEAVRHYGDTYDEYGTENNKTVNIATKLVKVIYWIALVIYLVWFLTAALVFVAVKTEKRGMLVPFLIFTGVITGLAVFGIFSSFSNARQTFTSTASIVQFVTQLGLIGVNVYSMICISTFYKNNLRETNEVNALPVTTPAAVSTYGYGYQPAPAFHDMEQKPYGGMPPAYNETQAPPVYGHDSMTQKI